MIYYLRGGSAGESIMLLAESEMIERIESPLNLLNRLRKTTTPVRHPSLPPTSSELIPDLDEKVNYGSARSKAMGIMDMAMSELKNRIAEATKPKELAAIASEMSKIISNTNVRDNDDKPLAQIVIYAPNIVSESAFDVIDVQGKEED